MGHSTSGPPPEAHGRVTNPERFRILHNVTRDLIDQLVTDYDVIVVEGPEVEALMPRRVDYEAVVRLQPEPEGAGALTVGFSRFPGLIVGFGGDGVVAYPPCGCDACNEDVRTMIDDFQERVWVLVFGGRNESVVVGLGPLVRDQDGRPTSLRSDWDDEAHRHIRKLPWRRRPTSGGSEHA